MPTLPSDAQHKALDYLKTQARPLDQALYAYHFEFGDPLNELAQFQNPDGGFGHGLEPDIRLRDSSVIATTIALQILRECHAPVDHPLVQSTCAYLRATYNEAANNWPIIPPNIDDAPHAFWWSYDSDLNNRPSNPRAEIAGYLNDYPEHFPAELRETVTNAVLDYLLHQPDAEMEMHDLLCYLRFYATQNLPAALKTQLQPKLTAILNHTVERDSAKWKNYGLPPLAVVSSPDSPFAKQFEDLIEANLNLIIETQSDDGAWYPNWSWGDQWPEAWEQARRDWAGYLTLRNLLMLRAFGAL